MQGWIWDRRRLENSSLNSTQYLSTVGGHSVGLRDGTKKDWWQSGTVEGCQYEQLTFIPVKDGYTWTPQVSIGRYAWLFESYPLYSDHSYTSKFSILNTEDNLMVKNLRSDTKEDTLKIAIYRRNEDYIISKERDFVFVDVFTGRLDESLNERLSTEDVNGNFIVSNISRRKYEYLIRDNKVYLNGIHKISNKFTSSPSYPEPPVGDLDKLFESHGLGQETGRKLLLKYFPVEEDSAVIWINENNEVVKYTETKSLAFSSPEDHVFEIDYDLGIIKLAGFKADDLFLSEALEDIETEIFVHLDGNKLDEYPDQGVIIIGDEQIAYLEKTYKGFKNCLRGYNGTPISNHPKGFKVEHRRMGKGTSGKLYVEYIAIPRIDYEVTTNRLRSANKSNWLNIKPIVNVETGNILQILPGDISLDRIVLETDSPLIGGNLYGPLSYGTDVSRLTATGYDARDNPVEDVELTISILEGGGFLNGSLSEYTDITNTLGQIYANYTHPLVSGNYEFFVEEVSYDGPDTIFTVPGLLKNVNLNDVWVFQILKQDKFYGTAGLALECEGEGSASLPYGRYYLNLNGVVSDLYRDGRIAVEISGVKYYRNIMWLEQLEHGNGVAYTRIYLDRALSSATGDTVYLFESDATEWNKNLLNGVRVILYEYRDDVLHPVTNTLGAFFPLKPDSVSGTQLRFSNRQLPIPAPDNDANNLGGYLVISPSEVSFQAKGIDPLSGSIVESNIVRLLLQLPSFFIGVDNTGALPIPVGWRFVTEEHNIGSGLGGANFITINPLATGINQFSLVVEF